MRTVIYTVESTGIDIPTQHQQLVLFAQQQSLRVVSHYSDALTLQKSHKSLLGLKALLTSARQGSVAMVLVHDMALLGLSISHLISIVNELKSLNVDVTFYKQGLSTTGFEGEVITKLFESLAGYEKAQFSERVRRGLKSAVTSGKKLGRPTLSNEGLKAAVVALRKSGMGMRSLASTVGLGVGTCYSILRAEDEL
jgi:DNA invertase Pin-like site-specific DNA recombinase